MVAECDLAAIFALLAKRPPVGGLVRFPPTVQDFAIVVDEAVPAGEVEAQILDAARPLAQSARLFDVYRGEQLPAGKKSLAFEVTFSAPNRVLGDGDLGKLRTRIAGTLQKRLRASLRS
jgi:phenylalanyl-tRNA synthetase beta chain